MVKDSRTLSVRPAIPLLFPVVSGLFAYALAQASTTSYRALFRTVLPFAAVHLLTVVLYVCFVRSRLRWVAIAMAAFILFVLGDLAMRAWF